MEMLVVPLSCCGADMNLTLNMGEQCAGVGGSPTRQRTSHQRCDFRVVFIYG